MADSKINADLLEAIQVESRKQAEAVYAEKATQYGVSTTPDHHHNGIDSTQLDASSVTDFQPYPSQNPSGVFSPTILKGQAVNNPTTGAIAGPQTPAVLYGVPIPIIYGYGADVIPPTDPNSTFHGGTAPLGSAVLFVNPSNAVQLFFRLDREGFTEGWWGVDLVETEIPPP